MLEQRASVRARLHQLPYDILLLVGLTLCLGPGFGVLGLLLTVEGLRRYRPQPELPEVLLLDPLPRLWQLPWLVKFRARDHQGRRLRVVLFPDQLSTRDFARLRRLLNWLDRPKAPGSPPAFDSL